MTPWREYAQTLQRERPKLREKMITDVVIIGGGITGVLNAYRLAKLGKKVILIEKKKLGSYATMDTTAFITEVIDSDLTEIKSLFGTKAAQIVWRSGHKAINEYERIISEEGIDCEFLRCSNYVYASTKKQFEGLQEEHQIYKELGLKARLQQSDKTLGFANHGYMEVPDQAKFHVTKFLYALADKAEEAGALIFENTEAIDIDFGSGDRDPVTVHTKTADIIAADVILATYKPLTNKRTHLKKGMYRSYVFQVEIPKGTFKEALYEDSSNPYIYFRIDPGEKKDYMIFGGEDHKDIFGDTLVQKSFAGLKEKLARLMQDRPYKIIKKWNGPILEPSDGLPLIGEIRPHCYVATAFSGNGMTYSMISSMIISDLIRGKKHIWADAYTPKRALLHPKRLAVKARDYAAEMFAGAFKNALR